MAARLSPHQSPPVPKTSLSGKATVSSGPVPRTVPALGSDSHRVPAPGDHSANGMATVGADFFSAADLASLELPGLPKQREKISRLATRQGWKHRDRPGRGGGREFALAALPAPARSEILRRRIVEEASKRLYGARAGAAETKQAPLPTLAAFTHRQASRHTARSVVLDAFDAMKGDRSDRATFEPFLAAIAADQVELPGWAKADVKKLSRRTLERWLSARRAGSDEALAGRWAGGRRAVFQQSPDGADFIVGAHAAQPALGAEELHGLLGTQFPQGLPDRDGVMMDLPSVDTVNRFLNTWRGDAGNAAALGAYLDPDKFKSHHRFAAGNASEGILRLNQKWEIDASPNDVLCADGRKNLYVVIDVAGRRVMALVTDTPRTAASLLLVARGCQSWGVPEVLGTDNGSDFISKHYRLTIRQLGIHQLIAPPYSPERKAFIERHIGTIQHKFMPLQPGFIGHNVADRTAIRARQSFAQRLGVSDQDAFAVALSSEELQERLNAWLANIYIHRPHAGLGGRTPHEVTLRLAAETEARFAPPAALGMLLMPPADGGVRVVGKKGVRVGNIDYWTGRLVPGQRLQVRLDPADMGRVYLYTDSDPWRFVGIGVNPELAGLDRAELAARITAEQKAIERDGRAHLRRLVKKADIHSVARRWIGAAPLALAANEPAATFTTPALDEAASALAQTNFDTAGISPLIARRKAAASEETPDQRYARAKALRLHLEEGNEIAAESRDWLQSYEGSSEWSGLKLVDDLSG